MPDRKIDTPTGDDPVVPAPGHESAQQNADGSVPTGPEDAAQPAVIDLSDLSYETTEEEQEEAKRRCEAIQARLDVQRALAGASAAEDALDRLQRRTDPVLDSRLLREQLTQDQQLQKFRDAAMGGSAARAIRGHMDVLDQQRRFLDPLLDRDFVRRLTGGQHDDLMHRAMALHDPDALQALWEKVDSAAALRITEHWRVIEQGCQHAHTLAPAVAFARNDTAMVTEAQRMLSVYGPSLAEQSRFLTEYWTNLGLFRIAGLTTDTYERADLLARIDMPATLTAGFDGYDRFNVERVRAYGKSALRELEADFSRDGNPVHAWQARLVARRYGIDSPDWVEEFIAMLQID